MSDTDYFRRNAAADIPDLDALDVDAIPIDLSGIPDFSNVGDLGLLGINTDLGNFNIDQLGFNLDDIFGSPEALATLQAQDPEAYNAIMGLKAGNFETDDRVVTDKNQVVDAGGNVIKSDTTDTSIDDAETKKLQRQADITASGKNAVANVGPEGDTGVKSVSADTSGIKSLTDTVKDLKKQFEELTGIKAGDAATTAAKLALMKEMFDYAKKDAEQRRKDAMGGVATGTGETMFRTPTGSARFRKNAAAGGIMDLGMAKGRYLNGHSDGMADKVPAHIDGKRPAALSDGEFVIPADVVSHLGNGNSNAGAKRLYEMMDRIRGARTGNTKQGKQINPDKFLPR
jgi:hypothetical protein